MAAPTEAALLDYETVIEDALSAYLANLYPTYQVLTPRTTSANERKLRTPRIEVALTVTGTGTQTNRRTTDNAEYDAHKIATLRIRAAIRRNDGAQSLGAVRGEIRSAMLASNNPFSSVQYYEIKNVTESGTTPAIEVDNDEIHSDVNYEIDWWIKPDQWPSS